ncbi:MAG: class I SAM-dependent methyltransferase, partial [bacterium]|nr:class I SAM-dependent methyltransferase [bacterium]
DLGCGSGAGLAALAEHYGAVVGIEPGLSNLILAKKALETVPAGRVLLVRGVGQALPFADGVFDYVQMQNVIEHVIDADAVAAETRRVLAAGGRFAADSRNRYDLFRREPHVHLRGVGFLPVRWQKRYVWFRRRIRYEQTRLWSYGELKGILKRHFNGDFRIVFPSLAAYGQSGSLDRWVGYIGRIPVLGGLLLRFFPSHWVFACKK